MNGVDLQLAFYSHVIKHLPDHIISSTGKDLVHKTSLNPATFYRRAYTKPGKMSGHVYVCCSIVFHLFHGFFSWIVELF